VAGGYAILPGVTEPADLVIPSQWTHLDVPSLRGTIMIIGASDTGKSTLARYLFQALCRAGRRVAYLDGDVGQSTLGVPTTMTVALSSGPGDGHSAPNGPQATYFVGSTTPRGHMLPVVVGAYRLRQKALALGAEVVVIDTTGLVDRAEGGRALKQWKIELLAPSVVIGLQRGQELEPILWPLRRETRLRVVEWRVSPHVTERTREARIARRRAQLADYFRCARPCSVSLRHVAVYDLEQLTAGALVALQDGEGFTLCLGVVEEAGRLDKTIVMRTPLSGLEGVASLRFGAARWDIANEREW
jgi:polynucleotide 5'-hydroxyl-kinase GRC3/NOL9